MNCVKCGRELREQQVFCDTCQADMEKYPVKPGTPVQLPVRSNLPETRKKSARSKKTLSPEIRLRRLRTTVRLLVLALVVALLAFVLTSFLTLHLLDERDNQNHIGQNYRIVTQDGE